MVSRRQFLSGSFSAAPPARRPPWHVDEASFSGLCSRCNACRDACPTRIVVAGRGGFPEVDFAYGECTFCGDCARSCPTGALVHQTAAKPWQLRASIGDSCLTTRQTVCRSCGETCPAQAIRFPPVRGSVAAPVLDAAACTGCGACIGVCPQQTISVVDPTPRSAPTRMVA